MEEAPRAYLFFGVFSGFRDLLPAAATRIRERYGPLHSEGTSDIFPFPRTRTYERTMGSPLWRQFFVLEELAAENCLAAIKRTTIAMEQELGAGHNADVPRPINIDPGLINDCRIILASTKDYAHRIYRDDGIWEEITLYFEGGAYRPHPWTYPDFHAPTYHDFFAAFRQRVLERRRETQ